MKCAEEFFWFARERETIRRSREAGQLPPWTGDHVLQEHRFCNVFREDDKTTVWFRENLRDVVRDDPIKSLMACAAFRWFNTVDAGEVLAPIIIDRGWDDRMVRSRLRRALRNGAKLYSGAYMLKSPAGVDKITGLCDCLLNIWDTRTWFQLQLLQWENVTLEAFHRELMRFPFLGRFMAYEVVTDLRHTCVLEDAPDILTWASAGPGAARGLGLVKEDNSNLHNYASKIHQGTMLEDMRSLLALSRDPSSWPASWPEWELREVEHVLCEYSKWRRGHDGHKLKRKFSCT